MRVNKLKIIYGLLVLSWLWVGKSFGQDDGAIFSYEELLKNVLTHHPIAEQAFLQELRADVRWLGAKGGFDPVVDAGWAQKNFDDLLYYRQYQGSITVPTPLGIDLVGGYENTEGTFLNPENKTDRFGLWNVGIEANLLQGLFVNERNTAIRQAQIFQNSAINQQRLMLNKLLYSAASAYFQWQQSFYAQQVLENNIRTAQTYFNSTRASYLGGEKTAMDTLEALIILQDAEVLLQANSANLNKAKQQLENYLWFDGAPVGLTSGTQPQDYLDAIFSNNVLPPDSLMLNSNPMILETRYKQQELEVEQRLKREKLKPKLKVKYHPLIATSDNDISPNLSSSNYEWGFDFSVPIFQRKARADVQEGKIKLIEVGLDLENKRNELLNKIQNSQQQQDILQDQLALQQQNISGYQLLLEGENEKFRFGESSVFLLNKRQEKFIFGQLKLIALFVKLTQERLNYRYLTNNLITQ
ncbi:MAG: TolC family protein [Bacteroidota bacterium]